MKFSEIVDQAKELLQKKGRISYRALKREFDLDDDALDDLRDELIEAERIAFDENGRVLVLAASTKPAIENRDSANFLTASTPPTESITFEGERRQITVMFCDLVGSTTLSEKLDPEDLREVMSAYQKIAGSIIERYEGHVAQYLGDGLMVYFGWPKAHEEDAARALNASLEILEAVKEVPAPEPLEIRIGIATGPVVVGETGAGDASVPKVAVGETPNIAARIQALANPDEIVVGPTTQQLAGGAFEYDDLGVQKLRGIAEPLRAWRVLGQSAAEGRFEAQAGSRLTPLIGRETEIAMMLDRWAEAKDGEGRVVLLSGEPGIGKSRITQELRERISSQPHRRLRYQCSPYYVNTAFYPIVDQLERAAGFVRGDGPESRLDKLEMLLSHGTDDVRPVAPLFAALVSLPVDRYPQLDLSPQRQREKTIEALAEQVVGLARRNPVLMIFEDAHWVDATTIDVLTATIERIQKSPVLAVITHRSEFEQPWTDYHHVSLHSLNRLSRRQGATLVAEVVGRATLPDNILNQIIDKTDGVPLFVEELTKSVLEAGPGDHGPSGASGSEAMAIPATLQDSLTARLDRLESGKSIAQIGACIGREFSYQLIAAIAKEETSDLDEALSRLTESALIYRHGSPPNAVYMFKHALVQETARQTLLRGQRQSIHESIAVVLQEQFHDTVENEPELLAHHYTEAGIVELAIPYWKKAGERAVQRSANAEACGHFAKAIELLGTLPESRMRDEQELTLQLLFGVPTAATKGYGSLEAERIYSRARYLGELMGDSPDLFPSLYGLYGFYLVRANFESAHAVSAQLLNMAEAAGNSDLLIEAHRSTGLAHFWTGNFIRSREHSEAGVSIYDPIQHYANVSLYHQDPGAGCASAAAWATWCLGYPDQALVRINEALKFARERDHPFSLAFALTFAMMHHFFRREEQATLEHAEEIIRLSIERGFAYWLMWGRFFHGWARGVFGDIEEGAAEINQGIEAAQASGAVMGQSHVLALLAETYARAGDIDAAISKLNDAMAFASRTGETYYESELHRLKGELIKKFRWSGERSEGDAERYFQKAIEIARRQRAKSWELRSAMSLARLLRDRDEQTDARGLLAGVNEWFTEGFDTKDLQDAKLLINELE